MDFDATMVKFAGEPDLKSVVGEMFARELQKEIDKEILQKVFGAMRDL